VDKHNVFFSKFCGFFEKNRTFLKNLFFKCKNWTNFADFLKKKSSIFLSHTIEKKRKEKKHNQHPSVHQQLDAPYDSIMDEPQLSYIIYGFMLVTHLIY
jgi:hypothetical protein